MQTLGLWFFLSLSNYLEKKTCLILQLLLKTSANNFNSNSSRVTNLYLRSCNILFLYCGRKKVIQVLVRVACDQGWGCQPQRGPFRSRSPAASPSIHVAAHRLLKRQPFFLLREASMNFLVFYLSCAFQRINLYFHLMDIWAEWLYCTLWRSFQKCVWKFFLAWLVIAGKWRWTWIETPVSSDIHARRGVITHK